MAEFRSSTAAASRSEVAPRAPTSGSTTVARSSEQRRAGAERRGVAKATDLPRAEEEDRRSANAGAADEISRIHSGILHKETGGGAMIQLFR
mmetsp:Transcript_12889/g.25809  ORF Transcript_12889/g.25809 Transcript_12889/m.25809 type:complete len:92 (-) Transcript_12889:4-279(-)